MHRSPAVVIWVPRISRPLAVSSRRAVHLGGPSRLSRHQADQGIDNSAELSHLMVRSIDYSLGIQVRGEAWPQIAVAREASPKPGAGPSGRDRTPRDGRISSVGHLRGSVRQHGTV